MLALVSAVVVTGTARCALAHEGPEHEIEEITARMAARGETADLLIDRAVELAVLGRVAEAMRDLERAVHLDPGSFHALRELARLQQVTGRAEDSLATLARALRLKVPEPADRGGLLILRAEVQHRRGRLRSALSDCQEAIRLHAGNPEWYLLRSELQRALGQHGRRLAGLEDGVRATGSGILGVERVEALLDAGRNAEALTAIEVELASTRVRCRWLVRRGRARIGLGRVVEGQADLREALEELAGRLDPRQPDASLLLDQATAWILLGDREAAERCHSVAGLRGGDPWVTARIAELLTGFDPKRTGSGRR